MEFSIKFDYPYLNSLKSYLLKTDKDSIYLKEFSTEYNIVNDTLIIAGFQKFTKSQDGISKKYSSPKSKIKIELPKLNDTLFKSEEFKNTTYLMFTGKRHDNGKYSLSSNGKYVSFDSLINIHTYQEYHNARLRNYFFIDKNTKMKEVELLLMDLVYKNQSKVFMINDFEIAFNITKRLHYKYQIINSNLSPFFDEQYLSNHTFVQNQEIPIQYTKPPLPPRIKGDKMPVAKIIMLNKNKLYIDGKLITKEKLKALIQNCISINQPIISIYDLQSNYASFLELNAIIHNSYRTKRQKLSLKNFNKSFEELDKKNQRIIKDEVPIRHSWSYSIPHFEKIIEKDTTFFGLKVDYSESH